MKEVKLAWRVKRHIQSLYKQRFSLQELYIMYRGIIPYKQLRSLTEGIKRGERI